MHGQRSYMNSFALMKCLQVIVPFKGTKPSMSSSYMSSLAHMQCLAHLWCRHMEGLIGSDWQGLESRQHMQHSRLDGLE